MDVALKVFFVNCEFLESWLPWTRQKAPGERKEETWWCDLHYCFLFISWYVLSIVPILVQVILVVYFSEFTCHVAGLMSGRHMFCGKSCSNNYQKL